MILVPNGSNYNPLHKSTNHIGRQIDAKDPHLVALRWFVHPQKRGGKCFLANLMQSFCEKILQRVFEAILPRDGIHEPKRIW